MDNEVTLNNGNPFFNYEKEINNLNFNKTADGKDSIPDKNKISPQLAATLRQVLLDLRNFTTTVGGAAIKIGLKILDFVFECLRRFPHTASGLLIIAILHHIATHIPLVGGFLNAFLMPIDLIIISATFLQDIISSDIFARLFKSLEAAISSPLIS